MKRGTILILVFILVPVAMAFSGGQSDSEVGAQDSDILELSWLTRGSVTERFGVEENYELMRETMLERFSIDLQMTFEPKNTFAEKQRVLFASGTYPAVMFLNDATLISEAVRNDVLMPMTDAIQTHPQWSRVPDSHFSGTTYDGEIYAAADKENNVAVLAYRSDWAQNLGIDPPRDVDQLYDMLKAFSEQDPDGNGEDDTVGFTMMGDLVATWVWNVFIPGNGGFSHFYVEDDEVRHAITHNLDNLKAALSFFQRAYEERVLDQEWIADRGNTVEEKFINGVTGIWTKGSVWLLPRYQRMLQRFPDAQLDILPADFRTNHGGPLYQKVTERPAADYVTNRADDVDRAIQAALYLSSGVGTVQGVYGVEGETYEISDDGEFAWLNERLPEVVNPGAVLLSPFSPALPKPEPFLEGIVSSHRGLEALTVNVDRRLNASETYVSSGVPFQEAYRETIARTIVGEIEVAAWDDLAAELIEVHPVERMLAEANAAMR